MAFSLIGKGQPTSMLYKRSSKPGWPYVLVYSKTVLVARLTGRDAQAVMAMRDRGLSVRAAMKAYM